MQFQMFCFHFENIISKFVKWNNDLQIISQIIKFNFFVGFLLLVLRYFSIALYIL